MNVGRSARAATQVSLFASFRLNCTGGQVADTAWLVKIIENIRLLAKPQESSVVVAPAFLVINERASLFCGHLLGGVVVVVI